MNNKKIYLISAFCGLLSFSACQNEEPLDAPVAKDALALMPAETPVGVQATLNNERGESRATRAEGDGAATNWYASNEIHPTNQYVAFSLSIPGAADPDKNYVPKNDEGMPVPIPFGSLSTTEPFSTLMLKDFNLTEGDGRCVSRWTALLATCNGWDNLYGFARLQADAQGNPVLNFGELKRAGTKVTLVLQDEQAHPILVNDNQVSAELSLQESDIDPIYTPEGETQGILFLDYLKDIKTLQADAAINPACFGWAAYSVNQNMTFSLGAMSNADGTVKYYGDQNNTLTTLVRPTPTHTMDGDSFTLIEAPQFTDDEVLTITVNTDPDGADGLLITGTYTLKLKDVKVTENGQQKPLAAMKSGEHLTLTVTLAHNMKVSATATIGGWDEVSADVDLNQDPSKMQPYTYDAETKTYTVFEEEYVKPVWNMKNADDKVMYNDMLVVDGMTQYDAICPIITGAIEDGIKGFYVINDLSVEEFEESGGNYISLGYAIYNLVECGWGEVVSVDSDDPDYSSLSFVLADVETIPVNAFPGCCALKSVSAPKATNVGVGAFFNCLGLKEVTLNAAKTIEDGAFNGCDNIEKLTLGSVIENIGEYVFFNYYCNQTWTSNCALTLASGQQHMTNASASSPGTPNGTAVTAADANATAADRTWAGYVWKSITISNNQ